jgi:DNA-binding transcriptional MocR family regulator
MSLLPLDNTAIVTVHSCNSMFTDATALIVDEVGGGDGDAGPSVDDRSARRIAATIGRMISAGTLVFDTRLPTVRDLARRLGVSPTTVSEAWRSLADVGAIETRGRNGTYVRRPTGPGRPRRYRQISEGPGHFAVDLSSGTPDPALLPDLAPVVARVSRQSQSLTSSYLDHPVLPELERELRATWPFEPEAITVVDGALDALDRVASVALHLGDRVIVEHPSFPPLLDLLDRVGCDVVGVDVDDEGLLPAQLVAATAPRPAAAVILQPRAQNPAGVAMSAKRARAIAEVLRPTSALVVEDDHANDISAAPLVSVGRWLPERTVHIRSFSKSHGPDLRLAGVGGAREVVTAVENRRLLGPGWSSRILQAVLVELIRDQATDAVLAEARAAYGERRRRFCAVLAAEGVKWSGSDGINLWVAVDDERAAVVSLAARGIGVAPGTPFLVRDPDDDGGDHIRVTVGLLADPEQLDEVAAAVTQSARLRGPRRRGRRTPATHR